MAMNDTPLHTEPLVFTTNKLEWPPKIGGQQEVVIFGINDYAMLAYWYITNDPKYITYKPVAFVVTKDHYPTMEDLELIPLPVYAFEEMQKTFDPEKVLMFAPLRDHGFREKIYWECRAMGYQFFKYISSWATVLSEHIGENCMVLEDNTIQPGVNIEHSCVLWSGNHIGHDSFIGAFSTVTSHCVISGHVRLGRGCYVGVNSTIRDQLSIAGDTTIGQHSNVVKSITEPGGVYMGNPAKKKE